MPLLWIIPIFSLLPAADGSPAAFDPWVQSARYELEYRADLSAVLKSDGKSIRLWLPTPADVGHQQVLSRKIESPWPYRETRDSHGNRIIYVEPKRGGAARGAEVVMRFEVEREPFSGVKRDDLGDDAALEPQRYLGSQRRIPLEGLIRRIAAEQSRGIKCDARKIRVFYDYVISSMRYSKEGEGWGEGDAIWACTAKYGNCTDFHSLFIGLARSQKIPARFLIGFPIPADKIAGDIPGYHCWAEVYDSQSGWLPLDASEAWKAKRFDDYFGTVPSDRVEFTVGRDLVLDPPQKGDPINYFIYPYAEIDGKSAGKIPFKFRFKRTSVGKPNEPAAQQTSARASAP